MGGVSCSEVRFGFPWGYSELSLDSWEIAGSNHSEAGILAFSPVTHSLAQHTVFTGNEKNTVVIFVLRHGLSVELAGAAKR